MTMSSNKIIVQNMVCPRCSESIERTLNKLKINFDSVSIGEIKFSEEINANLLVEKSAAAMITENELDNLPNLVNEILSNPERQQYMANNMHNLHMPNATAKIIKMLMEVA